MSMLEFTQEISIVAIFMRPMHSLNDIRKRFLIDISNMLIFGLGGVLLPFAAIKLIDVLLNWMF